MIERHTYARSFQCLLHHINLHNIMIHHDNVRIATVSYICIWRLPKQLARNRQITSPWSNHHSPSSFSSSSPAARSAATDHLLFFCCDVTRPHSIFFSTLLHSLNSITSRDHQWISIDTLLFWQEHTNGLEQARFQP